MQTVGDKALQRDRWEELKQWRMWAKGLVAAAVGGAANTGLLVLIAPDKFNFQDMRTLGTVAFAGALTAVLGYLKQSPLPNGKHA